MLQIALALFGIRRRIVEHFLAIIDGCNLFRRHFQILYDLIFTVIGDRQDLMSLSAGGTQQQPVRNVGFCGRELCVSIGRKIVDGYHILNTLYPERQNEIGLPERVQLVRSNTLGKRCQKPSQMPGLVIDAQVEPVVQFRHAEQRQVRVQIKFMFAAVFTQIFQRIIDIHANTVVLAAQQADINSYLHISFPPSICWGTATGHVPYTSSRAAKPIRIK